MSIDVDAILCCDRLKHGHRVTHSIINILKARASLEDEYANKLLRITKKAIQTTGSLGASLRTYVECTGNVARIHSEMADSIKKALQALQQFAAKQSSQRKTLSEQANRIAKQLENNYIKRNESERDEQVKQDIMQKLILAENDDSSTERTVKNVETTQKMLEKAERALELAIGRSKKDKSNYNVCKERWDEQSRHTATLLNDMEMDRVDSCRRALWRVANVQSTVAVAVDRQSKAVRDSLRKCTGAEDIRDFVSSARSARPPPPCRPKSHRLSFLTNKSSFRHCRQGSSAKYKLANRDEDIKRSQSPAVLDWSVKGNSTAIHQLTFEDENRNASYGQKVQDDAILLHRNQPNRTFAVTSPDQHVM